MIDWRPGLVQAEHRYLLSRPDIARFLAEVIPHVTAAIHDPARPVGYVRTTYLDTADQAFFHSTVGRYARRLRVREYALARTVDEPPTLTGDCFVEHKQSTDRLREKTRVAVDPRMMQRLFDHLTIDEPTYECLESQPPFRGLARALIQRTIEPCVTTWYKRTAYAGAHGHVRITLDEDLVYAPPLRPGIRHESAQPREVWEFGKGRILEVKVRGPMPPWLVVALAPLVENEGFSKFRAGVHAARRADLALEGPPTSPAATPAGLRAWASP